MIKNSQKFIEVIGKKMFIATILACVAMALFAFSVSYNLQYSLGILSVAVSALAAYLSVKQVRENR